MKEEIKTPKVIYNSGLKLTFDPDMKPARLSESLARRIEELNEKLSKFKNVEEMIKHANDSSHE